MGWIYLVVFLGGASAGLLTGRFLSRSSRSEFPLDAPAASQIIERSTRPQTANGGESALLAQLEQAQLAYQMASELRQFQAGFLARTSHELRSPINSVISLHQLILADLCESPEEEREYVAQASSAAQRMLAALDELIAVSKVQHGRIELELQPVNLRLVLDDVERLTHLQAQNKNLRLEIQFPDADVYVLSDPTRLRQVLVHLVDWAIADLDDGRIQVMFESPPAEGFVHITIADDRPEEAWAEATDLLKPSSEKSSIDASMPTAAEVAANAPVNHGPLPSGLTLFADRILMEKMQAKLDVVPSPPGDRGYAIRCSIPLIEPED